MSRRRRTALAAVLLLLPLLPLPAAAQATDVMAHLASYRSRAAAERGWHILTDQYSSILYTRAELRIVQLGAKGEWWRVYADGDQTIVRMLCDSMKQRKLYCTLHDKASLQMAR